MSRQVRLDFEVRCCSGRPGEAQMSGHAELFLAGNKLAMPSEFERWEFALGFPRVYGGFLGRTGVLGLNMSHTT